MAEPEIFTQLQTPRGRRTAKI